jgi:hypothetical protein
MKDLSLPQSAGSSCIDAFCRRHEFGRTTYFAMRKAGLGPKEIRIGRVVRISTQAEAEWIERMQSAGH